MVDIKVKFSHPDAKRPTQAHYNDAGFDLYAVETKTIASGTTEVVKTGIHLGIPDGYEVQIRPRSGLAAKNNLTVLNSPGTVDAGYRGEIAVIMSNLGSDDFLVTPGMRIAQMVVNKLPEVSLQVVATLDETERGDGKFGSSGTH